jgi:hypothetical protein
VRESEGPAPGGFDPGKEDFVVSIDPSDERLIMLALYRGQTISMIRENGVWSLGAFTEEDLSERFEKVTDGRVARRFHMEALAEYRRITRQVSRSARIERIKKHLEYIREAVIKLRRFLRDTRDGDYH